MIVITVGFPGSGKSSLVDEYLKKGFVRVNRDTVGGSLNDLIPRVASLIHDGKDVVLDNTYHTKVSRKPLIDLAKKMNVQILCLWLKTSIEDTQVNVCTRMMQKYGRLIGPEDVKDFSKDPGVFPAAVLFKFKKEIEEPTVAEGFISITKVPFVRKSFGYVGKAIILDYDGTLRTTKSGAKYPSDPADVEILPNRRETLLEWKKKGYLLFGASNQGDIGRGKITAAQAVSCFKKTNDLLGIDIEYQFCPHHVPPINCFCRKPMPGLLVHFIEKYKISRDDCVFVGDMTTDKTCATRAGVKFVHADDFFKD